MSEALRERETVITFNDMEDTANVWSCSPFFQRRMARLGYTPTKTADRDGTTPSHWYTIPKKMVRIVFPRPKKELSQEMRERLARMASARFSKRSVAVASENVDDAA